MAQQTVAEVLRLTLKRVPVAVIALLVIAVTVSAVVLACRHEQKRRNEGAVSSPEPTPAAFAEEIGRGRFTATIAYTLFGAESTGEISSRLLWDDAWFTASPTTYNHELARAAMLLSTLAYSESGYYQAGSSQPAYMEDALAALGFTRVSTESYRYRSEVVDEVLDAVTQDADGVAYTIASKQVEDADGDTREVIAVAVRGSYGSEWLSNFNMGDAADELEDAEHHSGYLAAAEEIKAELDTWRSQAHEQGREVSVLLCGHSRGGAVAGLLASMLDDEAAENGRDVLEGASAGAAQGASDDAAGASAAAAPGATDATSAPGTTDRIFAYTFASPRTTVDAAGDASRYNNIFNIVNPADPVPNLPLESWGFSRNGVTLSLPSVDGAGYQAAHERMSAAFEELTGERSAYDPEVEHAIGDFVDDISSSVPTAQDLVSAGGAVSVAGAVASHLDPLTVLKGHYPSVYLTWLSATDGEDLVEAAG